MEVAADGEPVRLTPCGCRTASALRREQINRDGTKLLES